MIRPTMSHAVNKDELHLLMSAYATHLEGQLSKANEHVKGLEGYVDRANELLEEVRASGDLGLYMDNKVTAFLVGDSEQLRKEQGND